MRTALRTVGALVFLGACAAAGMAGAAEAPFPFTQPALPEIPARSFSVLDYGARADGQTSNTAAIEKTIAAAAAAGGGTVVFPRGTYFTGPIRLRSHIALRLEKDAVVHFSDDPAEYPLVATRWECVDIQNYAPLIYAYRCTDIAITGDGTLDGNGPKWWAMPSGKAYAQLRRYTNDESKPEERIFGQKLPGLRPALFQPYDCSRVLVEGVTFTRSPFWTVHLLYSRDITCRKLTLLSKGPNGDGIDPDSCTKVLIEDCTFDNSDDAVAIKSGRDKDGRRAARPSEDIVVRRCVMSGGHGIAIGSETAGSVRRVLIEDCTVDNLNMAVRIKSCRGRGGVVEDVTYRNITIKSTTQEALSLNMRYGHNAIAGPAPRSAATPAFRNITVENITCAKASGAATLLGLPESPIQNLTLRNLTLCAKTGLHAECIDGLTLENVKIVPDHGEALQLEHVTGLTVDGQKRP